MPAPMHLLSNRDCTADLIHYLSHSNSRAMRDWLRSQPSNCTVVASSDGLVEELRRAASISAVSTKTLLRRTMELMPDQLVVGEAERRIALREIINSDPDRFAAIIGRDPEGKLFVTHAMLARLCRLVGQFRTAKPPRKLESPQVKQFLMLLGDYASYLEAKGAVEADDALTTFIAASDPGLLAEKLELGRPILVVGFDGLPSLLKLLLERLAPVAQVNVAQVQSAATAATGPVLRSLKSHSKATEVREIARAVAVHLQANPQQRVLACFPTLSGYDALARDTFRDFGIAAHVEQRMALRSTPLWSLLHYLRDATVSGFSYTALRQLAKSPLLHCDGIQVTGSALDEIRRAVTFSGGVEDFILRIEKLESKCASELKALRQVDETDEQRAVLLEKQLARASKVRAFLSALVLASKPLLQARPVQDWPATLRDVLTSCCNCIADDEVLERHKAAMESLLEVTTRVGASNYLLSNTKVSYAQLVSLLDLYGRDALVEPAPTDPTAVVVTTIDAASAGYTCDFLVVGGMVEGSFPRLSRAPEAWMNDLLPQFNRHEADISRQSVQFYRLLGGCTKQVLMTWPESEGSEELLPSQFLDDLPMQPFVVSQPAPRSLTEQLAQAMSQPEALEEHADLSAAARDNIAWCVAANGDRIRTDGMGGFDGFVSDPGLLKWLHDFVDRQVWSPSQLDSLVQCRFRYFMERIVGLKEIEDEEEGISPIIVGEAAHGALCRFYARWRDEGRGLITQATRELAATYLLEEADFETDNIRLPDFDRDWLHQRLIGHGGREAFLAGIFQPGNIRGHIGILGAFLQLEIERGERNPNLLQPVYFEVEFGSGRSSEKTQGLSSREPVRVMMDGEPVRLRGRIDRIDATQNVFALIDYKTGLPPTIESQKLGYRVQIPVYLLAAEQLFERLKQPHVPAGGLYYAVTHKSAEIKGRFFREQFRHLEAMTKFQKAMSEEQYHEAMELVQGRIADGIRGIRKGEFHITTADEKHACGYCRTATICRKDLLRAHLLVPLVTSNGKGALDE